MISAVIFDLDGTLVETEEIKAIAHAHSVTELNPEVAEDEVISAYSDLVGHSRQEVAEDMMRRFGLEDAARERAGETSDEEEPWQALVRLRRGFYEELLKDSDLLLEKRYSHNIDMLRRLRSEGYPTACATMSHLRQVKRVLSVLELDDAFDLVVTMDDVERGKPDPEIDLLVAEKMDVPPEEFLVVEDSSAGVGSALAAGMAVVAVPTEITGKGVRESGLLEERWIVGDPATLPDVVNRRIEEAAG
ncbi:MAG: HAD family phosphatase [Rubrobacteraceae bacterium]